MHCHAETISRVRDGEKTLYACSTCGKQHERSIVIDPAIVWWTDDTDEYWHESAGVFIKNSQDRFLFFERIIFPFALTIPSGHVDVGEDPVTAAEREVVEEVGITVSSLRKIAVDDIYGDQCRRGADVHRWHAYTAELKEDMPKVTLNHEGLRSRWLTLDEALASDIITPVRHMIEKYKESIPA